MIQKHTPSWYIAKLAGIFFAAYSIYNIFIFIKDGSILSSRAQFITALIAVLFGVLTGFAWSSEVKNIRFIKKRTPAFILALIVLFVLKLRMAEQVIDYIDFSKLYTILYGCTYLMVLAAFLLLLLYNALVFINLPIFPRTSVTFPLYAMILFICSLILEAVMFFAYGINFESNPLRTMVIRPIFYLGFVSLCAYFLLPAILQPQEEDYYIDDKDFCV